MELVANIWPVADAGTGIVGRYLMRAYAMDAEDSVISTVLNSLAPTDFRIAREFVIPERFKVCSPYGTEESAVLIGEFHRYQQEILKEGFAALEQDYVKVQGIDLTQGQPRVVNVIPRFPEAPYTVVTVLLETEDGQLVPQLNSK
ncbi:hypothetical protein Q4485_15795 [Granulosicoccaceae sp. 1_MG-2023]|nr:hypothetical protein [Granulosicoccaceae sp. 1_MG-2023]